MRIVFAGTPEYAVPSLTALAGLRPDHEVVAVVTQPDRPQGRSRKLIPPPVKQAALHVGIHPDAISQPRSFNLPEHLERIRALKPDLLCVVAYGGLLKKEALALARLFPLNAHGSILPRYRGAAPIQAAILHGDQQTGVTIMRMVEKLDSGPILLQREISIHPTDTAGTLHDRLSALSATCFLDAIRLLEDSHTVFAPQEHGQATYAAKLTKDSGLVDWSKPAEHLERFVRAMTPWPGAWSVVGTAKEQRSARIRLASVCLPKTLSIPHTAPGEAEVVLVEGSGDEKPRRCFLAQCGHETALRIERIQIAGKNEMSVDEFLRGSGRSFEGRLRFG